MSKEITVNALGENVKVTVPDAVSFDCEDYFELPLGFALHYEAQYDDEGDISDLRAVISDENGNTLSEYADSFVDANDVEETLERLTKEAVGNLEHDIEVKLKEARATVDSYGRIDAELKSRAVKGPGE